MALIFTYLVKGKFAAYYAGSYGDVTTSIHQAKRFSNENFSTDGEKVIDKLKQRLAIVWADPAYRAHPIWKGCKLEDIELRQEVVDAP